MLGATNFVEHYAVEFHATDAQKDFVKSAMPFGPEKGEKKSRGTHEPESRTFTPATRVCQRVVSTTMA